MIASTTNGSKGCTPFKVLANFQFADFWLAIDSFAVKKKISALVRGKIGCLCVCFCVCLMIFVCLIGTSVYGFMLRYTCKLSCIFR